MDRADYASTRDYFRAVRELGRDAYRDGEPRTPDFRDFDECDEWYAGYDAAKDEDRAAPSPPAAGPTPGRAG